MAGNKILMIGEKESFIVRVLVKKVKDEGIDCEFVPWTINSLNEKWDGKSLITVYMDGDTLPQDDALHYLIDKMSDGDNQMILIGEKSDMQYLADHVPGDLIYHTFVRPIDNAEYIKCVNKFFQKVAQGEFKKSILIVDDDPNYLGLVREWLKGTYKVSMANSGLQAIKWLGKNKADLILLDHEMPVTTGPQVLEMLRSDDETKSIPVMFLTGKSDKRSVMEVVALKPEGYFLKTIEKDELLEKLAEFFVLQGR